MSIPNTNQLITIPMASPFCANRDLDLEAAQHNVTRWLKTPISGYLIGSQSGEEFSLSEQERLARLQTVTETLEGDTFSICGIDCPSVIETLRQAKNYANAGAEMVRIRFPRYEDPGPGLFSESSSAMSSSGSFDAPDISCQFWPRG
jgi:dihydrodipicolinate synthase/N-acetylneuraminate lyase